jgi:hypothetical protein
MVIFFRQVETKCNKQSIISPIASALTIVADQSGVFLQALSNSTFRQIRAAQAVGVSSPCSKRRYPRVKGSAPNRRHSKQLRRAISDCSQTRGDSGDRHVQRVQGALKLQLGTAVFAGMIGVTFFGIFFTPVFFSVIMKTTAAVMPPPL